VEIILQLHSLIHNDTKVPVLVIKLDRLYSCLIFPKIDPNSN
jgi:hypothetical protein